MSCQVSPRLTHASASPSRYLCVCTYTTRHGTMHSKIMAVMHVPSNNVLHLTHPAGQRPGHFVRPTWGSACTVMSRAVLSSPDFILCIALYSVSLLSTNAYVMKSYVLRVRHVCDNYSLDRVYCSAVHELNSLCTPSCRHGHLLELACHHTDLITHLGLLCVRTHTHTQIYTHTHTHTHTYTHRQG